MKNIIEALKANKKIILTSGVVSAAVFGGLALISKLVNDTSDDEDDLECVDENTNDESDENSEEE